MKRVMLLAFVLLLLLCALPAHAAEAAFLYVENGDGTITVTGYTGFLAELDLPAEIDGKTVTAVGEAAFMQQTELSSVTLPDTVKAVARQAFYGCTRLTRVTMTGVVVLGDEALAACPELRVVTFGDELTIIGKGAFEGCKLLGTVTIPETLTVIGTDAFYGCEQVRLSVGDNAYAREWANANHIPLSFFESDSFTALLLCGVSAGGAVAVWFAWKFLSAWRKKKQAAGQALEAKTEEKTEENA